MEQGSSRLGRRFGLCSIGGSTERGHCNGPIGFLLREMATGRSRLQRRFSSISCGCHHVLVRIKNTVAGLLFPRFSGLGIRSTEDGRWCEGLTDIRRVIWGEGAQLWGRVSGDGSGTWGRERVGVLGLSRVARIDVW